MQDQFIITPYFLDEPVPGLQALAQPNDVLNSSSLPDGKIQARMSVLHGAIAGQVEAAIRSGKRPISIAGDCCTAIGVSAGLQRAGIDPFLIWLDAHGDFNTWQTTPSGFLGGMPLAMLVGRGEQTLPDAVGLRSLSEQQVVLCDGRDLDPEEQEAVDSSKIRKLSDASSLIEFPMPAMPLYVHFDTDIVDPLDAPAMNFPAPGGPRADELEIAFRRLARTGRIMAVSMSSWNPLLDGDGRSEQVCMGLLRTLLGADD